MYSLTKQDSAVVKGLAIIMMLWHHLFSQIEVNTNLDYIVRTTASMGNICVSLFLFVSAYGLTKQMNKVIQINTKTSIKFVLKRLLVFYSNYWIIFFTALILGVSLGNRTINETYENYGIFIADIFGVAGYFSYNITWWFNQLIILMYVLFPIYYICYSRSIYLGFITTLITMFIASYFVDYTWCFPSFAMGLITALGENNLSCNIVFSYKRFRIMMIMGGVIIAIIRKLT